MDALPPDQSFVSDLRESMNRREDENRGESDPMNFLVVIGGAIALVLLLLLLLQLTSVEPYLRFALMLLGMGVAALLLIRRSYSRKSGGPSFVPEDARRPKGSNALQITVENLDRAFKGDPQGQMLALQELKDLLVDRLALRNHMSRPEVIEMASDRIWLEEEVDQAELRSLLTWHPGKPYYSNQPNPMGQRQFGIDFPYYYRRILEQLEET